LKHRKKLSSCLRIQGAVKDYLKDNNHFLVFFETQCELDPEAQVECEALRQRYVSWLNSYYGNTKYLLNERSIGKQLYKLGIERKQKRTGDKRLRFYTGIRLIPTECERMAQETRSAKLDFELKRQKRFGYAY